MKKILQVSKIQQLKKFLIRQKKKVVLAGGCFDILHPGHIVFLEKAKKQGDILVVLLESDEKIKKLKGLNRPVHNQGERALILSAVEFVDFIITLPMLSKDEEYDFIVRKIAPNIIATTQGDKFLGHKKRAALLTGAKVKVVTKMLGSYSSSSILKR